MNKIPSLVPIIYTPDSENAIVDTYMVRLKEDCNRETHMRWIREQEIKYIGKADACEVRYLKGYEAMLSESALYDLAKRRDVESIVQDYEITYPEPSNTKVPLSINKPLRTCQDLGIQWTTPQPILESTSTIIQSDALWGLARLSQDPTLGPGPYEYPYNSARDPAGLDVYLFDSGIKLDHAEFGGRARFGRNFTLPDRNMDDGDTVGHNTHVAGIIGGISVGVAKYVNIISVKVLARETGVCRVVAAIEWVLGQVEVTNVPDGTV